MSASDYSFHPVRLKFKNQTLENEYKAFFDAESLPFVRGGSIAAALIWLFVIFFLRWQFPGRPGENMASLALTPLVVLPILLMVSTYSVRLRPWMQAFTAFVNTSAGLIGVYIGHFFLANDTALVSTLIILIFFAFLILRVRLKYAIPAAVTYVAAYDVVMILYGTHQSDGVALNTFVIWIGLFSAIYAGHIMETSSRKLFAQGKLIAEQSEKIKREREKSDELLRNILPDPIAERLKSDPGHIADGFAEATVLFSDIVGFTDLSQKIPPDELVALLNRLFSDFDDLADKHRLEKIKTIGDAYMAAAGLPELRGDHASAVADMALDMLKVMEEFNRQAKTPLQIRIGINTGPVVAGIIGKKKFIYDLWGDAVNTAARMESHGISGRIQITGATREALGAGYDVEERGEIEVKGKGAMRTYLLVSGK